MAAENMCMCGGSGVSVLAHRDVMRDVKSVGGRANEGYSGIRCCVFLRLKAERIEFRR